MTDRLSFKPGRAVLMLAAVSAALAACAGGGAGGPPGFGRPDSTTLPRLFVSPFGETFVGEPGDPWPVADWFTGADIDLDGSVTFAEFTADGVRVFGGLDTDRDQRIDPEELAAYEASLRPLSTGAGMPPAGGPGGFQGRTPRGMANLADDAAQDRSGGGVPASGGYGPPRPRRDRPTGYGLIAQAGFFNLPQPVKAADINVDQRVTTEEWATATERWFLALDTDQDGKLTLATLPATPLQARAAR